MLEHEKGRGEIPLFPLGRTVITIAAQRRLEQLGRDPREFLRRHHMGDWGDLTESDVEANEIALVEKYRLFSAYELDASNTVWVITEDNRSVTTILLPEDY